MTAPIRTQAGTTQEVNMDRNVTRLAKAHGGFYEAGAWRFPSPAKLEAFRAAYADAVGGGALDYSVHRGAKGGVRFDVRNPPPIGTELTLNDSRVMTYKGHGPVGMLLCTDRNDCEHLLFPQQIRWSV